MPARSKVAPSSAFSTSTGIQLTSSPVHTKSPDLSGGADRPARADRTGDRGVARHRAGGPSGLPRPARVSWSTTGRIAKEPRRRSMRSPASVRACRVGRSHRRDGDPGDVRSKRAGSSRRNGGASLVRVKLPPSNVTPQSKRAAGKLLRTAEAAVCGKGSNDGASAPGREDQAGGGSASRLRGDASPREAAGRREDARRHEHEAEHRGRADREVGPHEPVLRDGAGRWCAGDDVRATE